MNKISAGPVFFVGVCRWWLCKKFSINDLRNASPQTPVELLQDRAGGSEPLLLQKIDY